MAYKDCLHASAQILAVRSNIKGIIKHFKAANPSISLILSDFSAIKAIAEHCTVLSGKGKNILDSKLHTHVNEAVAVFSSVFSLADIMAPKVDEYVQLAQAPSHHCPLLPLSICT